MGLLDEKRHKIRTLYFNKETEFHTVPIGKRWLILYGYGLLTCDATVATRTVTWFATRGKNCDPTEKIMNPLYQSATASESKSMSINTVGTGQTNTAISVPWGLLDENTRFYVDGSNLQTGDTIYSKLVVLEIDMSR